MTFENYSYDGTLKELAASKKNDNDTSNKLATGYNEFEDVLQNKLNIIKDDPDARYNERLTLGDAETANIRIVGLGHSGSGNSSLMLRLFYNEYTDEPEDNPLLQWEQHQMNYKTADNNTFRISYFDLKGFDDILSQSDMKERIENTITDSFNVIFLYYSLDNRISFEDKNGYSVQDIKLYVDNCLQEIDSTTFRLILVGLKDDTDEREVSTEEGQNLANEWGNIPFVEVSSKTGKGMKQLLDIIDVIYNNFEYGENKVIDEITEIEKQEEVREESKEKEEDTNTMIEYPDVDERQTIDNDNNVSSNVSLSEQERMDDDNKDKEIINMETSDKDMKSDIVKNDDIVKNNNDVLALNTADNGSKLLIDKKESMTEPLISTDNKQKRQCCIIL